MQCDQQVFVMPKLIGSLEFHKKLDLYTEQGLEEYFNESEGVDRPDEFVSLAPDVLALNTLIKCCRVTSFEEALIDIEDDGFDADEFFRHLSLNLEMFQDRMIVGNTDLETLSNHPPRIGSVLRVIEVIAAGEFDANKDLALKILRNFGRAVEGDCLEDMQGAFYAITNSYWVRGQGAEMIFAARIAMDRGFDGLNGFQR